AQADLVSDMHDLQTPGAEGDEWRQRELETRAAGIKAVATWHATATIQTCREACGGAGYLSANLLPALKADTDVFTTFEGDNTVLLQLVAKTLLSDYGRRVARLSPVGKAKFAADLVADAVVERTGARALLRRGDVTDREYQRWLLVERERHLLANAAQRMRKALAPGADQFGIFNSAQNHLTAAASAHVDWIAFDSFAAAVDRTTVAGVRDLLAEVLRLYALTVVENVRAFFIEHSYL